MSILAQRVMQAGGTVASAGKLGTQDLALIKTRVKDAVYADAQKLALRTDPRVRRELERSIRERVMEEGADLPRLLRPSLEKLADEIVDEVFGYGPIQPLLDDPDVSEVMVNGPGRPVWYEKDGTLHPSEVVFGSPEDILSVIDRIVSPIGRRIDESSPKVDARLPDGSRINAVIPPVAVDGPYLTVRKFKRAIGVNDLVANGTVGSQELEFLKACVAGRLNIFISGGTDSGKTTFLNVLSSFIPDEERIVTIEDSVELDLAKAHVVRMEAREANVEGRGAVTVRDLVINALRMRPDRIVVGECRGREAVDMVQAMNTGHDGSLTTIHANSARDALLRVETMFLMGVDMPVRAVRQQIATAADMVVHLERLSGGRRRVVEIVEVLDMSPEGEVRTRDLFRFDYRSDRLVFSGNRPAFAGKVERRGVELPLPGEKGGGR